ncbi:hypothetical protein [Entomospira culicis]|uniref:Uncharacterized protein n=1 Tax=Entomospira culicis TaxID=2719989 RepID=A0A968GIR0_9SPIO|nr:hypothetical protein [Entomospira culicis]NIZ19191.1 hypothetical protein [Entomospira culicis]NIZ69405.1 hypothetical protein [Entomospira culicis]WDI36522.1 hypothetical protein PVA46_04145 [Entomospira culicis]WDI38148.1 hypothetical protein PVA47_04145 [Entomospira culicis]
MFKPQKSNRQKVLLLGVLFLIIITSLSLYSNKMHKEKIVRLPLEDSRLGLFSYSYAPTTHQHHLVAAKVAYKELFELTTHQERRDFIASYLKLPQENLRKPIVGDFITAQRLLEIQQDLQLNGLDPKTSALGQLAFATGLDPLKIEDLLLITKHAQSIDNLVKHYPNLASVEWELIIQSQELSQILQDFSR